MTAEAFTEKLREVLGDLLSTVALYGSSAAGDHSALYSDVNLLVVCSRIGVDELDLIAPITVEWAEQGNPPPLLFAYERLLNSSHVFPIELLDIKENHKVLYGGDVLKALPISQENLQFQLEHEMKGKLIQLRESYLLVSQNETEVLELMVQSLSAFQIMLKAALRFFEVNVPVKKREAVGLLAKHLAFDLSVFGELQAIRDGIVPPPGDPVATRDLFGRYIVAIEHSADMISQLRRRH